MTAVEVSQIDQVQAMELIDHRIEELTQQLEQFGIENNVPDLADW
jgi:hypothetical protein